MKSTFLVIFTWLSCIEAARAVDPALPVIPAVVFNVTDYGAMGDAMKDNTTNIQNCIDAAVAAGGGIVEIPVGTYLSGPIKLSSEINLQVDANSVLQMLPLYTYPGGTTNAHELIHCDAAHDVEISGFGAIDGQGAAWWTYFATNNTIVRPLLLQLYSVNRLFIHDITFQNPPNHHCGIRQFGGNITISNLTVNSPPNSPNTDGLNLVGTNCLVEDCHISDGDDNIAMGATGPLVDLLITNCYFGTGHGVSFGSGTSSGISNVTMINCQFDGTAYGIRMKSDTNSGGVVQDIHYYNIVMNNLLDAPITIYSYYHETGTPTHITPAIAAGEEIDPVTPTTPVWRDITISNITASVGNNGNAGTIWARTELPATNITIDHVTIYAAKPFIIYNARGVRFLNSSINAGPTTFSIWNADATISNTAPVTNLLTFIGQDGNTNDSLELDNAAASMASPDLFGINPLTLSGSSLIDYSDLTFPADMVMNFGLGTNASIIKVVGTLGLNGTLNVTNAPGFTTTNYTLMSYAGSASGQPALGNLPAGYSGFLHIVGGQVNLTIANAGATPPAPPTSLHTVPQ